MCGVDAVATGKLFVGHWEKKNMVADFLSLFFCWFEGVGRGVREKMMVPQAADVSPLVWL